MIIGIIAGAYTSIFVASPFWAVWKESDMKAKAEAAAIIVKAREEADKNS